VTSDHRKLVWVEREIAVSAAEAWALLVDVRRWREWGPSIHSAVLDSERFEKGATGSVRTTLGLRLPFEVTAFDDGRRWAWNVAHVPATDHRVCALGPSTSVVGFGVPSIVMPYTIVCRRALTEIDRLLTS
jgi:hypothetical protein